MHHAYPVAGAKVRTIVKNSAKSIVRHSVRKAVALAQTHVIVVTCFVPADAPDQPKKIAWHAVTFTMKVFANTNVHQCKSTIPPTICGNQILTESMHTVQHVYEIVQSIY